MVGKYLKAVTKDAWKQTWKRFAETWAGWIIVGVSFLIGVGIHAKYKDWSTALDDAVISVLTGFGGTIGVMILYFIWKWISAPYRLWKSDQSRDTKRLGHKHHASIAKELEAHLQKGQEVLAEFAFMENRPNVSKWREEAEMIVAKCGDGEVTVFRTLYPPSGEKGQVMQHVMGLTDLGILQGLLDALKEIMVQQLELAKEVRTPSD